MRLTQSEVSAIISAIRHFLPSDFLGELFIFGSRTDDSKKGGDIDLALIGAKSAQVQELKKIDYKIIAAIKSKKEIGDQKIDFKILDEAESRTAFFEHALKGAIKLPFAAG